MKDLSVYIPINFGNSVENKNVDINRVSKIDQEGKSFIFSNRGSGSQLMFTDKNGIERLLTAKKIMEEK